MSSSPLSRTLVTSGCRDIPSRRFDSGDLPSDYCTTPGGTIFSTTPGGTRIIYDRQFLLQMRNSPIARTPPKNLPNIPGVTSPAKTAATATTLAPATAAAAAAAVVAPTVVLDRLAPDSKVKENGDVHSVKSAVNKDKHESGDEAQFEMDI